MKQFLRANKPTKAYNLLILFPKTLQLLMAKDNLMQNMIKLWLNDKEIN